MLNKSTFFPLKIKICVQGLLLELDRIILHMLCIHFSWCQSRKYVFQLLLRIVFTVGDIMCFGILRSSLGGKKGEIGRRGDGWC